MNELHLFAGAGGGILGGMLPGHTTVCAVEIEPYCRKVLLQRQRDGCLPRFPIWDDVRTFDGKPWRGRVDVVCGGFPCQDISAAGKGAGLSGERSGLWAEMRRIVGEVSPSYVFVENSPMLTIRGLGTVLGDLATLGYHAAWGVLGACDAEAPHERERIWVLAYSDRNGLLERIPATRQGRSGLEADDCRGGGSGQDAMPGGHDETIPATPAGHWWETESSVGRVADGVACRLDRLHALGNGQVPQVAALAWRTLIGK